MNAQEHEIYLAEKAILEHPAFKQLTFKPEMRKELLVLIEKYGNEREQKGRDDVNEDWAESDAGASL
jgi:hypothetical protein